MSYDFDLDLVQGPGSRMRVSCTSCRDYVQDDSGIVIGDDQELPALRPNVAIIIIGLGFTLVVVVAFAVFAKFMRPHMNRQNNNNAPGGSRLWEDAVKDGSPVDTKVIQSLPLVVYLAQSVQGLKLDLECAVCLTQFDEGEELRLLPNCKHMFHPACIDGWLKSHPFCPLCRSNVLSTSWDVHTRPESTPLRNFQALAVAQELQRGTEDQQQQQSPSLEPHVEISVLEGFEARFEALRGRYYGRKGKHCSSAPEPSLREGCLSELEKRELVNDSSAFSPLPREGYLSELEKGDIVCDSSAFSSALGQGSNAASKIHKSENCNIPVSTQLCISVLPDVRDQGHDCSHAPHKRELAPTLCGVRFLHDCSSSTASSSTASASEHACQQIACMPPSKVRD